MRIEPWVEGSQESDDENDPRVYHFGVTETEEVRKK